MADALPGESREALAAYLQGDGIEVIGLDGDELLAVQAAIDGVLVHRRRVALGPELFKVWQAGEPERALDEYFTVEEPVAPAPDLDEDDIAESLVGDSMIDEHMVMDARLNDQRPRTIDRKRLLQKGSGVDARGEPLTSKGHLAAVNEMVVNEPPITLWFGKTTFGEVDYTGWLSTRREAVEKRYGEGLASQFHNMLANLKRIFDPSNFHFGDEEPIMQLIHEQDRMGVVVLDTHRFMRRLGSFDFGPKRKVALLCVADMQREEAIAALDTDTA